MVKNTFKVSVKEIFLQDILVDKPKWDTEIEGYDDVLIFL